MNPREAILAALDADDQQLDRSHHMGVTEIVERKRRNAGVRAVVEMHIPHFAGSQSKCQACRWVAPCPTIRALADAYAPGWSDQK